MCTLFEIINVNVHGILVSWYFQTGWASMTEQAVHVYTVLYISYS